MGINFTEGLKKLLGIRKAISEEFFEELTDLLVEGDFGPAGAYNIVDKLRKVCKEEKLTEGEGVRIALAKLLEGLLLGQGGSKISPLESSDRSLTLILLLGVNGVGKTTTAAKLAAVGRSLKWKPILAAADTFRAAAVDQLKIHGERLGVRVVAHKQGGDPAAVIYDALEAAQSGGGDLIIADTAGRMHTKLALVKELKKIDRVVESKTVGARYIKWLVLDAATGRNALVQAETFHEAITLDGVIMTKFDSSAKGGVIFSLVKELKLPVVFICDGEKYGDLKLFDPHAYSWGFAGLA